MENPFKRKRIGVLMGGMSSEREVSLESGRLMAEALRSRGYEVVALDVGRDVAARLVEERVEVAVVALHGTFGEDGCIQGLLEILGIPYTGSGVRASAVAMDKETSRTLFAAAGLPVVPGRVLERSEAATFDGEGVGFPLVVKPAEQGSSIGVAIVRRPEDLPSALAAASRFGDGRVVVERYVEGTEVTVGLLDGEVLGTTEIVPALEFYDYETKYRREDTRYFSPARVPPATEERLFDLAARAARALSVVGGARADFIVDRTGSPWILEVNTLPGMTSHSLLPMCARLKGISYEDLVERILAGARLWR